jgi:hypothetical protein
MIWDNHLIRSVWLISLSALTVPLLLGYYAAFIPFGDLLAYYI